MSTYADRLADALARRLPDDVTVTNSQGLLVFERGNARAIAHASSGGGDFRRAVTDTDARDVLATSARKLRGEVPKYREEFRALSLELAEILEEAAAH